MKTLRMKSLLGLGSALAILAFTAPAGAAETPSAKAILEGAELVGSGPIAVYRKNGSVILSLPPAAFGKPFIWYAEVVGLPAGTVSDALEAASLLARLERHGDLVVVRDLTTRASKASGNAGEEAPGQTDQGGAPLPGSPDQTESLEKPIDVALNLIDTGPAIAAFPVAAELPDGAVLVDVTQTFSNDIASLTARDYVNLSGLVPAAVDPARSYVERVKSSARTLNIRSHLTFLATNPQNPVTGVRPVSVVVGHSLVFLPEKPMAWREADPRVGFITAKFTEYESGTGNLVASRNVITRFRLEKKDRRS